MPTEGFWISPEGDLIEIRDHFEEVRANPEVFGFTARQASGWKRDDRDRVLRDAISRGWTRVRGHRDYTTFEIPELNQETGFAIEEFLRRTGAWENEAVEIHEVKTGKRWRETAGYFLEERHLALLGAPERHSEEVYCSVALAEALENRGFLKSQRFHPRGNPEVYHWGANAGALDGAEDVARDEPDSANMVAAFMMGLDSGFGDKETFTPEAVRTEVMKWFH